MAPTILHSLLEMGYELFYAFTLLVSLWRYPKYFDTPLKLVPILYLYTFLNELLGYFTKSDEYIALIFTDVTDNSIIYNLYTIISYLYYYYIFWSFSRDKTFRKNIQYGTLVFLTSCIINVFLESFASDFQTLAYVVGGCVLLYCTISYLWHFISLRIKFRFKQNILFWISLGLTIFYMGYLPIKILKFYNFTYGLTEHPMVRSVHLILIYAMYTMFIVGFIRMKRPLGKVIQM